MFSELARIPGLDYAIPTYGVLLALSFLTSLFVAVRLAGNDGLDRDRAYDLALYTIGASLVGSKVLMPITEPWLANPSRLLSSEFWSSAGVYFGGFLGAFTASIGLARLYKMPWWRVADAFAGRRSPLVRPLAGWAASPQGVAGAWSARILVNGSLSRAFFFRVFKSKTLHVKELNSLLNFFKSILYLLFFFCGN